MSSRADSGAVVEGHLGPRTARPPRLCQTPRPQDLPPPSALRAANPPSQRPPLPPGPGRVTSASPAECRPFAPTLSRPQPTERRALQGFLCGRFLWWPRQPSPVPSLPALALKKVG